MISCDTEGSEGARIAVILICRSSTFFRGAMATRGRSPQDGWRVSQLRFEVCFLWRVFGKPRRYHPPLHTQSRIGVGSHGQIFRATDQVGGVHVVKVLSRDDADTNIEVAALRRVQRHPNVISLEGPVEYSAESAFVILEHCDSDLLELVLASGGRGLPVELVQYYFAQLVKALRHCHHKGVCHGDLKPENALIKGPAQGGVLKLCDFGSASLHRRATRAAGSVIYSAPEVLPLFHLHVSCAGPARTARCAMRGIVYALPLCRAMLPP